MKKVLSSALISMFSCAVMAQTPAPAAPATPQLKVSDVAKFNSEVISLGNIRQGTPTKGTFTVTNIGTAPLIIEQANPTCGCTISDYTKEPIAPGKAGVINATYNAANQGHFEKHLTVKFAGVNEIKSITLTGDVLPAADYDKWKATSDSLAAVHDKMVADSLASSKTVKKHKKTTTVSSQQ